MEREKEEERKRGEEKAERKLGATGDQCNYNDCIFKWIAKLKTQRLVGCEEKLLLLLVLFSLKEKDLGMMIV